MYVYVPLVSRLLAPLGKSFAYIDRRKDGTWYMQAFESGSVQDNTYKPIAVVGFYYILSNENY
jgi:hypothetical protein